MALLSAEFRDLRPCQWRAAWQHGKLMPPGATGQLRLFYGSKDTHASGETRETPHGEKMMCQAMKFIMSYQSSQSIVANLRYYAIPLAALYVILVYTYKYTYIYIMCIYIYIYIYPFRAKDSSLPNYPCKVDPDSSLYRASSQKNAKKPPGNEKNMGIFSSGCYILGLDIFPNLINQLWKFQSKNGVIKGTLW